MAARKAPDVVRADGLLQIAARLAVANLVEEIL